MSRDAAEQTYIRAGELEVFRQLQRDAVALDADLVEDRAFARGAVPAAPRTTPCWRRWARHAGAINNLWGSQEAFRAAVMHLFLNDETLGVDEVDYPDPRSFADPDSWTAAWAAVEIDAGPRHGMPPENRYGLRWVTWLGLVPYGFWSESVAAASMQEYRDGAARFASQILEPALAHFELELAGSTTIDDVTVAASSIVEGFWLNAALTADDPLGRPSSISATLATSLQMLLRGATQQVAR